MDYRERLYSSYVTDHTSKLYKEPALRDIEAQFKSWNGYYGKFLPEDKKSAILDAGCGSGGFLHFLKSSGFEDAQGVDISAEQVKAAEKLGIRGVLQGDIKEFLADSPKRFDLIFARDLLEHFSKKEVLPMLCLFNESLKDNGKLIIQTPNAGSPFGGFLGYGDLTHETFFTATSLSQALCSAGFRASVFYPAGPVPYGIKSTARFVMWKGAEALLKALLVIETGSAQKVITQNIIACAEK